MGRDGSVLGLSRTGKWCEEGRLVGTCHRCVPLRPTGFDRNGSEKDPLCPPPCINLSDPLYTIGLVVGENSGNGTDVRWRSHAGSVGMLG